MNLSRFFGYRSCWHLKQSEGIPKEYKRVSISGDTEAALIITYMISSQGIQMTDGTKSPDTYSSGSYTKSSNSLRTILLQSPSPANEVSCTFLSGCIQPISWKWLISNIFVSFLAASAPPSFFADRLGFFLSSLTAFRFSVDSFFLIVLFYWFKAATLIYSDLSYSRCEYLLIYPIFESKTSSSSSSWDAQRNGNISSFTYILNFLLHWKKAIEYLNWHQ